MSSIFDLNLRDVLNSGVSAVIAAVLSYIATLTNVMAIDPKAVLSIVVITFITSIAKKLGSNEEGKFMGSI